MRVLLRSTLTTAIAAAGVSALVIAPLAPPEAPSPPTTTYDVRLAAAAPPPAALIEAFLRNQVLYCSLICTAAIQGVETVPIAVLEAPAAFVGALRTTGSLVQSIGVAAATVTQPANASAEGIFNNDVFRVVPKAFNALDVAVVAVLNIPAESLGPGGVIGAINTARSQVLDALTLPLPPPVQHTAMPQGIVQVAAVSAIDVTTAIAFQAGELLLLGVVETANSAATTLAQTGNVGAAVAAGAATARGVVATAGGIVTQAVDTAATNIRNTLPHPMAASTAAASGGAQKSAPAPLSTAGTLVAITGGGATTNAPTAIPKTVSAALHTPAHPDGGVANAANSTVANRTGQQQHKPVGVGAGTKSVGAAKK